MSVLFTNGVEREKLLSRRQQSKTVIETLDGRCLYHGERKLILNENDSWSMSSSWFTVNKKKLYKGITSTFSMFQNAFIGNVTINMYRGRDAIVWQSCSENVSLGYTIKLPYKVI